jgi:hypothetical protein
MKRACIQLTYTLTICIIDTQQKKKEKKKSNNAIIIENE